MKKLASFFFIVIFLLPALFLVTDFKLPIYAQNLSTESNGSFQERLQQLRLHRDEAKERWQEKRQNILQRKQEIKERIATKQAEIRAKIISRIKAVFSKILKRFQAALNRLDRISERIASRVDKLKERGVDTSAAEQALVLSEGIGAAAQDAISEAQLAVDSIDPNSATVREAVHAAKNAVKDAKRALQDYHRSLAKVLRELKASVKIQKEGTGGAGEK